MSEVNHVASHKSDKIQLSEFARGVGKKDGGLLFANFLYGTQVQLIPSEVKYFENNESLLETTFEKLLDAKIIVSELSDERAIYENFCNRNREDNNVRNSYRIGFLLDELQDKSDLARAIEAASNEIAERSSGQLFLQFWAFTETAFELIPYVIEKLSKQGKKLQCDLSISLEASFDIDENIELIVERCVSLFEGNAQVVFMLHQGALEKFRNAQQYSRSVFFWQSLFFRYKFNPAFILFTTRENEQLMAHDFYEELCFSGVYPRNIHMAFVKDDVGLTGLTCEMFGIDHSYSAFATREILTRPTHKLIEPFALGFTDVMRSAITRDSIWPRTFHCPYTRPTMFFAGKYSGACPVALSRAATGDTAVIPLLTEVASPDPQKQRNWIRRGPHTIAKCRTCSSAPICGSGCPLAAFEQENTIDAPDCPPISKINKSINHMAMLIS